MRCYMWQKNRRYVVTTLLYYYAERLPRESDIYTIRIHFRKMEISNSTNVLWIWIWQVYCQDTHLVNCDVIYAFKIHARNLNFKHQKGFMDMTATSTLQKHTIIEMYCMPHTDHNLQLLREIWFIHQLLSTSFAAYIVLFNCSLVDLYCTNSNIYCTMYRL